MLKEKLVQVLGKRALAFLIYMQTWSFSLVRVSGLSWVHPEELEALLWPVYALK